MIHAAETPDTLDARLRELKYLRYHVSWEVERLLRGCDDQKHVVKMTRKVFNDHERELMALQDKLISRRPKAEEEA